ncbi:zinc finger, C3HC4 type [Ancylostoma ceylanicum]|uniref:Zinc finger, C3HC4 type n=1 Tax=Ancylostoma ceylanicum TaxID=53326 RepID=A0A0D6LWX5_9BILA|nr:zinc finger, C3HC4 type [Ancylostoma ceylanicum]
MANDWIHCNACYRQPTQKSVFFLSSCGHIICQKCTSTLGDKDSDLSCPVCHKNCAFTEINRNLRPELQILFRNPKDVATQYMRSLAQVLEFQGTNRTRLAKHVAEREKKAVKFAHLAREEIKKRIEMENKAVEEHTRLKHELDMERFRCRALEAKLAENEKQLEQMQKNIDAAAPVIIRSDSGIDAEMDIDSNISFLNVATSTPIKKCSPMNRFTSTGHRNRSHISEMFATGTEDVLSPITFPNDQLMTTPAMLGLKPNGHSQRHAAAVFAEDRQILLSCLVLESVLLYPLPLNDKEAVYLEAATALLPA